MAVAVLGNSRSAYIHACSRALMLVLRERGEASLAEARHLHGVFPPEGIDGRAAGTATRMLVKAGAIEPTGRFHDSPFRHHHDSPSRVWRLVPQGAR